MTRHPIDAATVTYLLLRAFVDELARCGMCAACTSPGSRCAPLVLTLASEPRLRCYSHVDERCSGFFALGMAKASGLPVAATCTSGTAAAELLPAVIEAREARVPLLLLTADRPPELRENGAGQAIDQLKLFGSAAKWFFEVNVQQADADHLRWMRTLACRAYWTTLDGTPGPVHLNFPLREPLVADQELAHDPTGRTDGQPYVGRVVATLAPSAGASVRSTTNMGSGTTSGGRPIAGTSTPDELSELVSNARRGVLIAGRHERQTPLGQAAAEFAAIAGWPLLADPLSGARRGPAAIAHYDALLRDERFAASVSPDLVLRVGDLPVSKPLRTWLASLSPVPQAALDPEGAWQDPAGVLSHSFALEPAAALRELAQAHQDEGEPSGVDDDWLATWRSADERAARSILATLGDETLSEPAVAAELGVLLPPEATTFVASSMPVRDVETFWPVRADPPRVLCNRGANGIDGTVSSAFGAAAHARESAGGPIDGVNPVVLLIGDVALAHDIGGLLAATRLGLKLTIVLIDNGGGGIFDFLAVSNAPAARQREAREPTVPAPPPRLGGDGDGDGDQGGGDIYTRHIATPTGLDFAKAASLYGLAHERVDTVSEFRAALEWALSPQSGSTIVHVHTDRASNVDLHRRMWDAVSRALSESP